MDFVPFHLKDFEKFQSYLAILSSKLVMDQVPGKMSLRPVEQAFSSFSPNFLAYLIILQSGALYFEISSNMSKSWEK